MLLFTFEIALFSNFRALCFFLNSHLYIFSDTQYQRRMNERMRRKAMSGPDGQLNRLRALNGAGNGSGAIGNLLMSEYNPNYEFGGGTCTLQDLKEIPRENLRLVK